MNEIRFSRRYFFYGSLLAGAVPAGGFGSQPSLKALGYKSVNEKLGIACIGLGMRGPQILPGAAASENIVALCDVDETRGAPTIAQYPKANRYENWRKMLDAESKNLDGVMIAVPDHWHTHMCLEVMQRGKHVYCEKPLTRTVWEARLLAQAALKYKVATQMGNQGFSHEGTKTACEILWSGEIGEVREVHSWTGGGAGDRGYPASGPPEQPLPAGLDWDMWLGPAPFKPYTKDLATHEGDKKTWWFISDYALGFIAGWGIHPIDIAAWGGDLFSGPIEVEGRGTFYCEGACDTATVWQINLKFANNVTMKFVGVPNGGNQGKPTSDTWPQETEWKQRYRRSWRVNERERRAQQRGRQHERRLAMGPAC